MTTTRAPERPTGTTSPTVTRGVSAVLAVVGFLALTAAGGFLFLGGMLSGFDGTPADKGASWFVSAAVLLVAPWIVAWAVTRRAGWALGALVVGALATLAGLWGAGTI